MKKRIIGLLCVGVLAVGMLAGCGGSGGGDAAAPAASAGGEEQTAAVENTGETYTLIVHQHDPEQSATGQFLNAWAAAVEEASGGQLDIQVMHGGTMGGPKDTVDMIKNGTCDIGWGLQSFFPDTFPVTEVFQLPGLDISRATQGSAAIWEFWNTTDYMDDEYADFHVLFLHTNCQSPISTTDTKLTSISDMAGMNVRANSGPPTMFVQNVGANPTPCPINDLYSNLDKGEMQACITDWHAISSFKLDETIGYYLDENVGVSTYFLMMNKQKYDSLPDDLKKVLDDVSANSAQYTEAWDAVEDETKAAVADKCYKFDDAGRAELEEAFQKTTDDWIAAMNDKGYDGQAIYDKAVECIENAAK
ncbi:MAG: TRAP transporter substrate-binding protein [Lachnospiraceae bacterium]|jgi:TRAP-type C4-dicarboxylate transport system substrate-binding protein|nr:TRAP transporter substrate-binding protein [Lachnospiraceae bacterium]